MRRPKPFREWKRWAGTLGLVAALAVIAACDIELPVSSPSATLAPSPTATSGPQLVAAPTALPSGLPQLLIRAVPGDLPRYDRDDWRQWVDDDGDCQNARHETLIEESRIAVTFTNEERCSVSTGEWLDPFTGDILTSARDLDVDHMVPLSNAHRSGAWAWDDARRRAYANDLSYANHLIAVTNSVNRAKSDQRPRGVAAARRVLLVPIRDRLGHHQGRLGPLRDAGGMGRAPSRWPPPAAANSLPRPRRRQPQPLRPEHDGLRLMRRGGTAPAWLVDRGTQRQRAMASQPRPSSHRAGW